MSSYLSKSKKAFKPKAPVRRPAAPISSQSSTQGSVERQIHSKPQTPQSQSLDTQNSLTPALSHADGLTVSTNFVEQAPKLLPNLIATAVTTVCDPEPRKSSSAIVARIPADDLAHTNTNLMKLAESVQVQDDLNSPLSPLLQDQQPPRAPTSRSKTPQHIESPHLTALSQSISETTPKSTRYDTVQVPELAAKIRKLNNIQTHEIQTEQATDCFAQRSAQEMVTKTAKLTTIHGKQDNTQELTMNFEQLAKIKESIQHTGRKASELATKKRKKDNAQQSATGPTQSISPATQNTIEDEITPSMQPAAKKRRSDASGHKPTRREHSKAGTPADLEQTVEDNNSSSPLNAASQTHSSRRTSSNLKDVTSKAKRNMRMEAAARKVVAAATRKGRKRKTNVGKSGADIEARRRRGRNRSFTPEDAETVEIAPATLKMSDLCRDLHHGKKSIRSEEIRVFELEEAAKKRAKKVREGREIELVEEQNNDESQYIARPQVQPAAQQTAPRMEIVNGVLVLVEGSNRIDRHAEARGNQSIDEQTITHESSLSHRTNQRTNMKVSKRENWDEEMTDLFYDGLRMFGTDFGMICRMFPGRSRRTIKLKFAKEEKVNEAKIDQILRYERRPVDLEEFSKLSKTTYDDVSEHKRDLEEDRRHLEEEQAKQKEAMDELIRRREDEVAAESGGIDGDCAKENEVVTGKKAGRTKESNNKTKAQKFKSSRRGQPPNSEGTVEVLGPIG